MKVSKLKKRLSANRTMQEVSFSLPEDVVEDLKRIAPHLGFTDYQALMRAYVGQGLRADSERLAAQLEFTSVIENLRRHGVKETVIASAIAEAKGDVQAEAA